MMRLLAPALALLAGCATTTAMSEPQAEDPALTKALAGKVAGPPRRCLQLTDTRDSQTFKGAIIYRIGRSTVYRNSLNECPYLGWDRIPIFRNFGSQVCSGDIVTFVDRISGIQTGSCAVGEFVPYQTPKS